MFISIIIFLVVGGGIAVFVNLLLPQLWYRLRLRGRRQWALENGFQPCEAFGNRQLEPLTVPPFQTRCGKVLSCLSRGPLTLVDYVFTESIGGQAADSVDVRRARTAVLFALHRDAPFVTVTPRAGRVLRFLLDQLARVRTSDRSLIEAVFASIATGDDAFDSAFQVLGDDEIQVRASLSTAVRELMLANRRLSYEIRGSHAVVYASGPVMGEELGRLIVAADKLRDALF